MYIDQIPRWRKCPRCGEKAYEVLRSHSHCVECLYGTFTTQNVDDDEAETITHYEDEYYFDYEDDDQAED